MEKATHIPGCSFTTMQLVDILKTGKPGDRLEVAELSAKVGRDLAERKGEGYLRSARNRVLMDCGLVWKPIRGEGKLECLDSPGKMNVGAAKLASIRRQARRTVHVFRSIDEKELPEDDRRNVRAMVAQYGLIGDFALPSATKKLAAMNGSVVPDGAKLLEALKN